MRANDALTVTLRLSPEGKLGETMNKLRSWLDREKIQVADFKTAVDPKGYVLIIGFPSPDAADRFRQQFVVPEGVNEAA